MKDNYHIFEERYDWETVTYRFAAKSERRLSGLGQHRRGNKLPPSIRAGRQLELRIIQELTKLFPVTEIIYEYVKARANKGFSPVMVGQGWMIEQLSKIASTYELEGWKTSNIRRHLGLEKNKDNKSVL